MNGTGMHIMVCMSLVAEKTQTEKVVRDKVQLSTASPEQDVTVKPEQEVVEDFELLEARGGNKDILLAARVLGENKGVWVLEGLRWVKQCDVPEDLAVAKYGVCFCAVADGLVGMGGWINRDDENDGQIIPICYHYSLSKRRWRRLPDMITPKGNAEAIEIRPMAVMVLGGSNKGLFSTECEILSVSDGEWSSVRALPEHIMLHVVRVTVVRGRVFIMGLYGDWNAPNCELLEYNPSSDTYTKLQTDFKPGSDYTLFFITDLAAIAGKPYLVGAINIEHDIATQHVTQLAVPNAMYRGIIECCATVRGKSILLCGGQDENRPFNAIEEYNTTTGRWAMLDISLPFLYFKGTSFVANISV